MAILAGGSLDTRVNPEGASESRKNTSPPPFSKIFEFVAYSLGSIIASSVHKWYFFVANWLRVKNLFFWVWELCWFCCSSIDSTKGFAHAILRLFSPPIVFGQSPARRAAWERNPISWIRVTRLQSKVFCFWA